MIAVTVDQMRELDRATIEDHGIAGATLMERAGRGVADAAERLHGRATPSRPRAFLAAGKGNNGGDAFVAARHLAQRGWSVDVCLTCRMDEVGGDARTHLDRFLEETGIPVREWTEDGDWERGAEEAERGFEGVPDVVIDGLLGTGIKGAPRGVAAAAIRCVNRMGRRGRVLAIDIPSGLNGDTGARDGECVCADMTVTMAMPTKGLLAPEAVGAVGTLEAVDIGFPPALTDALPADGPEWIADADVRGWLPRRALDAHKGQFGRVLCMGGAVGYTGAIRLAGRAAVRSGAGLVTVLAPAPILDLVSLAGPELMVEPAPATDMGSLAAGLWQDWRKRVDDFDALLVGPGMTRHNDTMVLVRQLLRDAQTPMVLDADAISVFAGQPHWFERADCPLVLTPHPGELGRLFGQSASEIREDRVGMALAAAKFTGATVVLKGAGTVVAQPDGASAINLTGNPGMATGGTGDVLAGLIAGLVAQGLSAWEAACAGVYLHGLAGDLEARLHAQAGLIAGDVADRLPDAFARVSGR